MELMPYEALVRIAARFELGIERKGSGAWNALSENNQAALTDRSFIFARLGHVIHHATKLQAKLSGAIPDDGEDDAAAIGWAAMFLCCATKALAVPVKNCSACGGTGSAVLGGAISAGPQTCPACKGTGKAKA